MADLLSAQDRIDAFAAFDDLADTFFQYLSTLKIRTKSISPIIENKASEFTVSDVVVRCLAIPEKTDADAMNQQNQFGSLNNTQTVIYYYWADLKDASLADSQNVLVVAGRDTVVFAGKEMEIMGIDRVGPLKNVGGDFFVLAKFHVKHKIK